MRIWTLAKRLIKQLIHDKRTLGLVFVAPLVVFWLLSLAFSASNTTCTLDLVQVPQALADGLNQTDATLHSVSLDTAKSDLANGTADGYIEFQNHQFHIVLEGSDPAKNAAVMQAFRDAAEHINPNAKLAQVDYLHGGSELKKIDYFAPVLIGFFIFLFVFMLSGVSFLRERTGGTLERMFATPLRRIEMVLGYFLGFGLFAVLQTIVVQWFALNVIHVHSAGSFWIVLVINLVVAAVALSLGLLLSAFAKNEFQVLQFIPLVIVPQVFLSGLFDLRGFPHWLMWLSNALPLTFAANALRGAMIRGQHLPDLQVPLWVLLGYCAVFLSLNVLVLRRYRKV
jgi:ABC-2 type transport system permease protein